MTDHTQLCEEDEPVTSPAGDRLTHTLNLPDPGGPDLHINAEHLHDRTVSQNAYVSSTDITGGEATKEQLKMANWKDSLELLSVVC